MVATGQREASHRRLTAAERAEVLRVLDSGEFIHQPPREVYAQVLSLGTYSCSIRTMYRILRERGPVKERQPQKQRIQHAIPRLEAVAPN